MSILKSTNSGAQQRLTLEYLENLGYEKRGLLHIGKFYDWGEDINDSNEDVEVEMEIDFTGSTSRPNDYNLLGVISRDFVGEDGVTYSIKTHVQIDTVGEFLVYKRIIIKNDISEELMNVFSGKETTYSTINVKR